MRTEGRSVDEVIDGLPRGEQIIVNRLRSLIFECLPTAREYVKFGVPFYARNRLICFIWPPSIFSGPSRTAQTQQAKGTALGFWQGNNLANEDGLLEMDGKQVAAVHFKTISEIDDEKVRALLFEAELVDRGFGKG
jgi:hypothetical protein